MKQYLELLQDALDNGTETEDRTGVGTLSVFGRQTRYDLQEGFPAVTTKRLAFKSVVAELLWFIRGNTNVNQLRALGSTIWDEWADPETGELGPVYGHQWRSWGAYDQLQGVIEELRVNPNTRRALVSAWNVADIPDMALPPCHFAFQFYARNGKLSCQVYQRSADLFLGVPFNVASYALLTHIVADQVGMDVGELVHTLGDAHIYMNHVGQVKEQLSRFPLPLPQLSMRCRSHLEDYQPEDFKLVGYDPHPAIKGDVAV